MGIRIEQYSKISRFKRRYSRNDFDTTKETRSRITGDFVPGEEQIADFAAVQNGTNVDLTWTARSSDFTEYYIYRSTDNVTFTLIHTTADGTVSSYSDSPPAQDTYYYYMTGLSTFAIETGRTETISIFFNVVPTDPSNLAVTAENEQAELTWDASTDVSGIDEYILYLDGAEVARVPDGTLTYTYTGLTNGTSYDFGVQAVDNDGSTSAIVTITDTVADTIAPATPTGLTQVSAENGQAQMSWNANVEADLDGYNLYVDGVKDNVSVISGTTYTVTGLTDGVTYAITISAVDTSGNESAQTAAVNVTPVDTVAPATPTGLATTGGISTIDATWDANSEPDLDGYNIYVDGVKDNVSVISGTSYTVTGLSAGFYDVQVSAVDTAGNESVLSAAVNTGVGNLDEYIIDFEADTPGAQPGNWTERYNSIVGDFTVRDDGTRQYLEFNGATGAGKEYGYSYDPLDGRGDNSEITFTARAENTTDNSPFLGIALFRGQIGGSFTGYAVGFYLSYSSFLGQWRYVPICRRYSAGGAAAFLVSETPTTIAWDAVAEDVNVKVQNFEGTFRAKFWRASDPEPSAWDFIETDTTITTGEYTGIVPLGSSDYRLYEIELDIQEANFVPIAPTGVSVADNGDGTGEVTWTNNTEDSVVGYNIYVDGVKDNGTPQSQPYVTSEIGAGNFDITVSAVDTYGNESAQSGAFNVDITAPFAQAQVLTTDKQNVVTNTTAAPITGTGAFSIEFWIKTGNNNGTDQSILGWGDDGVSGGKAHVKIEDGGAFVGYIRFEVQGGRVIGSVNVTDGIWHHVAITVPASDNCSGVRMYIDGIEDTSLTVTTQTINIQYGGHFMIGGRSQSGATQYGLMSICEVRIWSTERTQTQVQENAHAILTGAETGLEHYYKFDGDLTDSAGTLDLSWSSVTFDGTFQDYAPMQTGIMRKELPGEIPLTDFSTGLRNSGAYYDEANNRIIFAHYFNGSTYVQDIVEYDLATGSFTTLVSSAFPNNRGAVYGESVILVGDVVYIMSGTGYSQVQTYDLVGASGNSTYHTPTRDKGPACAYDDVNDIWYLFSENDIFRRSNTEEVTSFTTSPANNALALVPVGHCFFGTIALNRDNSKIYVKQGGTSTSSSNAQDLFYEYDIATNSWTQLADFPVDHNNVHMVAEGNYVYVYLRRYDVPVGARLFRYDISGDFWICVGKELTDAYAVRLGVCARMPEGRLMIFGGQDNTSATVDTTQYVRFPAKTGLLGSCDFNGSSYLTTAADALHQINNQDKTYECWCRINTIGTGAVRVFDYRGTGSFGAAAGMQFSFDNADFGNTAVDDGAGNSVTLSASSTILTDDDWHHVALVWDNSTGTLTLYIDGVQHDSATNASLIGADCTNARPFRQGAASNSAQFVDGQIADMRIWNEARSESQIRANMFTQFDGQNEANLVGYWRNSFYEDETGQRIVQDESGNGNDMDGLNVSEPFNGPA